MLTNFLKKVDFFRAKKLQEKYNIEKRKREVYEDGYNAVKKSYSQLLDITKDLVIMVGNDKCNPNEIYRAIELATKYSEIEEIKETELGVDHDKA